jgi:S1-C subfamily serine protease
MALHCFTVKPFSRIVTIICLVAFLITGCVTQIPSNSVSGNDSIDPRNADFKRMLDQYVDRISARGADNDVFFQVGRRDELAVQKIRFEKGPDGILYMKLKLVNQPAVRAESIRLRMFFHEGVLFWGESNEQFPVSASIRSAVYRVDSDDIVSVALPGTSELRLHGESMLPAEVKDNRIAGTAMWLRAALSSKSFTIVIDEIFPSSANLVARVRDVSTYSLSPLKTDGVSLGAGVARNPPAVRTPQHASIPSVSYGTGFVFSNLGYVVTNNHVIDGAKIIYVQQHLPNGIKGRKLATLVKRDSKTDLAILKVLEWTPPNNSPPRPPVIASSGSCKVGDSIFVIGYPLHGTLSSNAKYTKGDISDLAGIRNDPNRFQHTAAIQPGNSGGPTCLSDGRVIGIVVSSLNDMYALQKTGSLPQGVNFSIKSDVLLKLIDDCGISISTQPIKAEKVSHVIDYTVQVIAEN